ncbi:MAG: hypothetical protein J0H15_00965 [Xanthomonadales bacterium]|nr:hypothetical protein [Xanthomonadales bacterium]
MRALLGELRRRNVLRAAAFYAASAWLLVQVATQVFPFFAVPDWAVRAIVVAALVGFPFAMLFAWVYEWTPQGLRREDEVPEGQSITHLTGRRLDRWIIGVLCIALGLLLVDKWTPRGEQAAPLARSIAVLPLLDEGGAAGDEYFSDGLSEELISRLGQIPGLKVIGRNSSFAFKGKPLADSQAIGDKLGVATLLEGTVRRQGDRVRIDAELIEASDGRELWSHIYDREVKDIFAIQADIAQAVADALQVTLLGRQATPPLVDADAHNAYLRGLFYFERHNWRGYRDAVAAFGEAIRIAPDYALAYAGRAIAWSWLADVESSGAGDARAAARVDARKAVELAPSLAEAHAALGWVDYFADWDFDAALAELRHAEQLAPGNARNKSVLSHVLLRTGHVGEALALARQAVALDPLSFEARDDLARVLVVVDRLDEARAQAGIGAELEPAAVANQRWQVVAAVLRGQGDDALAHALLEPNSAFLDFETALAQDARGDRAASDQALQHLIATQADAMAYQIAEAYAMRGDADDAFHWLEHAFATRDAGTLGMLIDPLLKRVRGDPRYAVMLHRLGLPIRETMPTGTDAVVGFFDAVGRGSAPLTLPFQAQRPHSAHERGVVAAEAGRSMPQEGNPGEFVFPGQRHLISWSIELHVLT